MKNMESGTRRTIKRLMSLVAMLGLAFGVMVIGPRPSAARTPEQCNEITEGCQQGGGLVLGNTCQTEGTFIRATCTKIAASPAAFEEFGEECEDIAGARFTILQVTPLIFAGFCEHD